MPKKKIVQTYVVIGHRYRGAWIEVWRGSSIPAMRSVLKRTYPEATFLFGVPHAV